MSDSLKIPRLRAARVSRRVAMPRFRSEAKKAIPLTEAVHRVLMRAMNSAQPFAVFAISGRLVISNVNTDRFKTLRRRSAQAFIGIYGPGLKIADALDDLREHFSDEVTNGGA